MMCNADGDHEHSQISNTAPLDCPLLDLGPGAACAQNPTRNVEARPTGPTDCHIATLEALCHAVLFSMHYTEADGL